MECLQDTNNSPESNIVPYENLDTKQVHISGEKFHAIILGICDNCHWCYTAINDKGLINICPVCNNPRISKTPLNIDEMCLLEIM
jgi:hypothetical protein